MVTASFDNTARLWQGFSTQELIDYANKMVPRCLTNQQRERSFLPESKTNLLVTEAENLAKKGMINEAIAQFKQAKEIAPCFKFDPESKAKRIAATALMEKGQELKKGKLKKPWLNLKGPFKWMSALN